MYQDYYQYLQWLQSCIQAQEQRIVRLETTIQQMREELKQIKEKPTIHVGTIEYKFDQLKVETLEGTLNIGLNPSDLSGIDDLSVQNQSLNTPLSPKAQMQRSMKIEETIYRYLETDLPQIIEDTQNNLNIQPNESYLSFIKQDIMKQLPNRIEYHLKANTTQDRSGKTTVAGAETIIELLKQEINNGVYVFLNHLPDNVKGMKSE
jgi:spore germination protein PC